MGGLEKNGVNMKKIERYKIGGRLIEKKLYEDIEGKKEES